jgi:exodeoxyribonuclease VIII
VTTVTNIPSGTETSEQYHRSGAWGSTLVSTFTRSPALAHEIISGRWREPETAAMRLGSAFHTLMDPGGGFSQRYQLAPDLDHRTKEWKAAVAAAKAAGVALITPTDWDALHRMADSVRANPVAASLLDGAEHEVGFRMPSPYGGYRIQCRADLYHPGQHLGDLKTTDDLDGFQRTVVNHGYHRQAALYRFIVAQACGRLLPFSFVAVEKDPPLFRCRVFDLTEEFLAIGWQEVEAALVDIGQRYATGDWAEHRDAVSICPPGWLLHRLSAEAA